MGDITGTTFAGHEVRDVIGTDLVSTLYRATEPDDEHAVALRVVARDLCVVEGPDRELYRRFRSEARASLTFEHAHALQVEEIGEHHGQGYLITPFVDAVPLSRLMHERSGLPLAAVLDLCEQLADVLDTGHEAGLAHGAVNPSTLMFARPDADEDAPDTAYLTGHGVGALLELRLKRDRKRLTVVDDLLYVAPEQLRQQEITGRTDQYALACALLHLATGAPPFERDSIGGLFGAHLFVEPELDGQDAWAPAVRRGMAKEPEERFDSCGALIAAARDGLVDADTRTVAAPAASAAAAPAAAASVPRAAKAAAGERAARDPRRDRAAPGPDTPARREVSRPATSEREEPRRATPERGEPRRVAPEGEPAQRNGEADPDLRIGPLTPAEPASRNGSGSHPPPWDGEDVPLLSDVLSQHDNARSGLRSPAALVLLALVVVAVAVVIVWFVA